MPRGGFTLVEMLVVLAIMGILSAILFPVFGSAREAARTVTCSSNLKQIYLGTQMYLQNSGGSYPDSLALLAVSPHCGWANQIYPYVKSTEVFECPNAENGEFKLGCPLSEDGVNWDGSYDYNLLRTGTRQWIREAHVGQPSKVALFVDGGGGAFSPYDRYNAGVINAGTYDRSVESMQEMALSERGHNGGLNICFADGHIKRVKADNFLHRDLWINTRDADYNFHAP